ncbi:MFS transporter [Phytoactinopolyspora alkaliphila]|uniref:MFS transporter n=1 Tax=Phytoactinopolyspora alkaliphila TaxID=1783498 RepID=UPI001C207C3A
MSLDAQVTPRSEVRRLTLGVAVAGTSSFALLYAPQPVLAQLAAEFRLDPGGASLAISVATGALALAVLPIAVLSEVIGRRRVITGSLAASAVLSVLLPFASSYGVLLAVRAAQGVAIAGVAGVAAAFLVERLGRAGVTAAIGAMIAGNTMGGMLGRLCAGFSADTLGWRGAFGVVAGFSAVCTVLTLIALPRTSDRVHREDMSGAPVPSRGVAAGMAAAVRTPVLRAQYVVAFVGMGTFVAVYNSIGFRLLDEPFALSSAVASLVFLAYAAGAVSSVTAGTLVSRIGKRRALVGALFVTAVGATLTVPDSLPWIVAGIVTLTTGFFAAHSVANGWAAAAAPEGARGQVSGSYTSAYYLGSSIAGAAGAAVYGHGGWTWLVVAVVTSLGGGVVVVTLNTRRR